MISTLSPTTFSRRRLDGQQLRRIAAEAPGFPLMTVYIWSSRRTLLPECRFSRGTGTGRLLIKPFTAEGPGLPDQGALQVARFSRGCSPTSTTAPLLDAVGDARRCWSGRTVPVRHPALPRARFSTPSAATKKAAYQQGALTTLSSHWPGWSGHCSHGLDRTGLRRKTSSAPIDDFPGNTLPAISVCVCGQCAREELGKLAEAQETSWCRKRC